MLPAPPPVHPLPQLAGGLHNCDLAAFICVAPIGGVKRADAGAVVNEIDAEPELSSRGARKTAPNPIGGDDGNRSQLRSPWVVFACALCSGNLPMNIRRLGRPTPTSFSQLGPNGELYRRRCRRRGRYQGPMRNRLRVFCLDSRARIICTSYVATEGRVTKAGTVGENGLKQESRLAATLPTLGARRRR